MHIITDQKLLYIKHGVEILITFFACNTVNKLPKVCVKQPPLFLQRPFTLSHEGSNTREVPNSTRRSE